MRYTPMVGAGLAVAAVLLACSSFSSSDDPPPSSADAGADACTTCGDDANGGPDTSAPDSSTGDPVVAVRAGGRFACALRGSGAVSCWGRNEEGQAGLSTVGDLACTEGRCRTPTLVPGLANVTHLSAGQSFACARTADGAVLCWGSNEQGALGMSGTQVATRFTPGVVAMLPHALDVSAGQFNACARVDEDGGVEVYCWGTNRQGMNGSLAVDTTSLPKRVPALSGAKSVVLSRITEHGCAILADDHVACWGTNAYGSLGHVSNDLICPGGTLCNHVPSPVGNDFKAVELALGAAVGCARVVGTGEVQCWGYNGAGMLGLGGVPDGNDHPAPAVVPGTTGATAIAAGYVHACAVVGGTLRCWGSNAYGELANGYQSDVCGLVPCKTSPQTVKDLPGVVVRISDGFNASFASTTDGKEWAWGANPDARLGHVSGASGDQLTCSGKPGVCNPVPQSFPIP